MERELLTIEFPIATLIMDTLLDTLRTHRHHQLTSHWECDRINNQPEMTFGETKYLQQLEFELRFSLCNSIHAFFQAFWIKVI